MSASGEWYLRIQEEEFNSLEFEEQQYLTNKKKEMEETKKTFWEEVKEEDNNTSYMEFKQSLESGNNSFEYDIEQFNNGNTSAMILAIKFKKDIEIMKGLISQREEWIDLKKSEISDESDKYGKSGYMGYSFQIQHRTTIDYSNIDSYNIKKNEIKEIENKAKLALKLSEKGVKPVDSETGEELPIPNTKVTSYLKTNIVK